MFNAKFVTFKIMPHTPEYINQLSDLNGHAETMENALMPRFQSPF